MTVDYVPKPGDRVRITGVQVWHDPPKLGHDPACPHYTFGGGAVPWDGIEDGQCIYGECEPTIVLDPAPMETGTEGTVESVSVAMGQICVDWDPEPTSGQKRTLNLMISDPFEVIS